MGISDFLKRALGSTQEPEKAADDSTTDLDDARALVSGFLAEVAHHFRWENDSSDFAAGKRILDADRPLQAKVLVGAVEELVALLRRPTNGIVSSADADYQKQIALGELADRLMQRKLPLDSSHIETLCERFSDAPDPYLYALPWGRFAGALERHSKENELGPAVERCLRSMHRQFRRHPYADARKMATRLEKILAGDRLDVVTLKPGDAWANALLRALDGETTESRELWTRLFAHARTARSARPSSRWLEEAEPLVEALGREHYAEVMSDILQHVGKVGSRSETIRRGYTELAPTMIDDTQADLFRGLIWASARTPSRALFAALGRAAEQAYKKLPNIGPRAPKIGNACVHTLALMEDPDAVAQLSRVRTQVKHGSAKKQIEKALQTAADKLGMTARDLEERVTPSFDMTGVGIYREAVGELHAEITVTGTRSVELVWIKVDGKRQKSIPKLVKEVHPGRLKNLKRRVKEIQQMLPSVRARLERLAVEPREWRLSDWRARYLDHPLVGTMARRLIWHFERDGRRAEAAFDGESLVDVDDRPVDWLDADTRVTLWHPMGFGPDDVLQWRRWLERHGVTQPFKQAHREIYVITDAELETHTYSNRFAAHLLRQHQFNALCRERGWSYTLQGAWDSHNTPYLELPYWGIAAEFWVEGLGEYGPDTSEAGIYLYISTDQVRFRRLTAAEGLPGEPQALPLSDVPALAFSEVMRDVDLFVGVCSVGNDPTWIDRGDARGHADYWHDFSFGTLGATALTRKQVLANLLPSLKVAERCSLQDRFLVVRGDRRTYKIHLGSGNILMEPNDQYLCIVPARSARGVDALFLPFEGDATLDVILSKAFMLADDTKIQDPTIVRQISPG